MLGGLNSVVFYSLVKRRDSSALGGISLLLFIGDEVRSHMFIS